MVALGPGFVRVIVRVRRPILVRVLVVMVVVTVLVAVAIVV